MHIADDKTIERDIYKLVVDNGYLIKESNFTRQLHLETLIRLTRMYSKIWNRAAALNVKDGAEWSEQRNGESS